jgi:exosortase
MASVGRWYGLALALGAGLLLYAYGPTLVGVAERWSHNPQYSHGYLVPAFALVLLWLRRRLRPGWGGRGAVWGVLALAVAVGLHLTGARLYFDWLSEVSLLPALAGLCLCLGGWPALRWAWPSIAFLFFMLPLPYQVETAMAYPLQRLAAASSAYLLQTMGFSAFAEGATITMENVSIGVVEACSGLGMLVTFAALSTAVVMLLKRPWMDKAVLLASTLPIALIANLVRITLTAVLAQTVSQQWAEHVFHDLAGWFMMPLALGLIALEMWVLSKLWVPPPRETAPVDLGSLLAGPAVPAKARPRAGKA